MEVEKLLCTQSYGLVRGVASFG